MIRRGRLPAGQTPAIRVEVRLDAATVAEIDDAARHRGVSRAEYARMLIDDAIDMRRNLGHPVHSGYDYASRKRDAVGE